METLKKAETVGKDVVTVIADVSGVSVLISVLCCGGSDTVMSKNVSMLAVTGSGFAEEVVL